MNIQIEPILLEHSHTFTQLLNLYNYDFTEYTNNDINENGYFHGDSISILTNNKLHSFFVRVNEKLAGFVIVGKGGYRYLNDESAHNINQFFVMKKYRKNGVGKFMAEAALNMFKGKWEVCQMQNNIPARNFWKSVIAEYTKSNYQECGTENDKMVGFIFSNANEK